jgi:hypothetical protein
MVLYDGSKPREAMHVDLGGWETEFRHGVRLDQRKLDADAEGWYVVGLEALQHLRYEQAKRAKGVSLQ